MKNVSYNTVEIEQLQQKILHLKQENAELTAKLNWFEEHYRLDQHRLYGRSSEKTAYPEQRSGSTLRCKAGDS